MAGMKPTGGDDARRIGPRAPRLARAALALAALAWSFAATPADAHFGHHPFNRPAVDKGKHDPESPPAAPAEETRTCCGICALSGVGHGLPEPGPIVAPPRVAFGVAPSTDHEAVPGGAHGVRPPARAPPVIR